MVRREKRTKTVIKERETVGVREAKRRKRQIIQGRRASNDWGGGGAREGSE